jgi:hypothetical protein
MWTAAGQKGVGRPTNQGAGRENPLTIPFRVPPAFYSNPQSSNHGFLSVTGIRFLRLFRLSDDNLPPAGLDCQLHRTFKAKPKKPA